MSYVCYLHLEIHDGLQIINTFNIKVGLQYKNRYVKKYNFWILKKFCLMGH